MINHARDGDHPLCSFAACVPPKELTPSDVRCVRTTMTRANERTKDRTTRMPGKRSRRNEWTRATTRAGRRRARASSDGAKRAFSPTDDDDDDDDDDAERG